MYNEYLDLCVCVWRLYSFSVFSRLTSFLVEDAGAFFLCSFYCIPVSSRRKSAGCTMRKERKRAWDSIRTVPE